MVAVRPVRLQLICILLSVIAVVACAVDALTFPAGHANQVAVFCLGLLVAAGIMVFARPRVRADRHQVWVRNIFGSHTVTWDLVTAVRFDDRSWWAALEFPDHSLLGMLAVQALDGERAVTAIRELRELHAAARA